MTFVFIECSSLAYLNILNLLHLFSFLLRGLTHHVLGYPPCLISPSLFTYFVHFLFPKPVFHISLTQQYLFLFLKILEFFELIFQNGFWSDFFSHHFPWHSFSSHYFFLLPHHISFDSVSLLWVLSFTDAIKNSLTLKINVCLYCCLQSNSSDVYSPSGFCLACLSFSLVISTPWLFSDSDLSPAGLP